MPGLLPGPGPSPRRRTSFALGDPCVPAGAWPTTGTIRLLEGHRPDGALLLTVDHHPQAGYRIHAPEYGTHVVSPSGDRWVGAPAPGPSWRWQQLLCAQVLPTIAALHGLEVFHAAAVGIGERVYGLVGPSGAGKSSTAAHLIGHGARFLADDVLAIEERSGVLWAHPGPRLANLHADDLQALPGVARRRLGALLGSGEKQHLSPEGEAGPLALGGIVLLTRAANGPPVTIARTPGDAVMLLGTAFAPHVATPGRLERRLRVCSTMAAEVPLWMVSSGPRSSAEQVAAHLWRHLSAEAVSSPAPAGRRARSGG